jgi:mannose-6-phosphate isomerase-like protein (cupin superfamily)
LAASSAIRGIGNQKFHALLIGHNGGGIERKMDLIAKEIRMDHWSLAALLERAEALREQAEQGDGAASITLSEFPRHSAMLLVRTADGNAELHENFADLFHVLEGSAALVTGGTIADAASIAPGEVRGSGVVGGARQELRTGEVAHLPAGLPHQMVVADGQSITCLVMKIREKP